MSKIQDESALLRTRATWLAEKLDINFTRASALVQNKQMPTAKESKKITHALKQERTVPIYMKQYNVSGKTI